MAKNAMLAFSNTVPYRNGMSKLRSNTENGDTRI